MSHKLRRLGGTLLVSSCLLLDSMSVAANEVDQPSIALTSMLDRSDSDNQSNQFQTLNIETEQLLSQISQERDGETVAGIKIAVLGNQEIFTAMPFDFDRDFSDHLGSDYHNNYQFVKLNNNWLNGGDTVILINKNDRLINSLDEFNSIVRQTIEDFDLKGKRLFATFDLNESIPLKLLLANACLSIGQVSNQQTIGNQDFYSRTIRIMNYVEGVGAGSVNYENTNAGLDRYLANDDKIKALIDQSGAMKERSEKEKLRKWCLFIANNFEYDQEAAMSIDNKAAYNRASDIFAITERGKGICVGYSAITARALNLMGIKAYVVGGLNAHGIPHQVTRVNYDGQWYFLDTTSANLPHRRQRIDYFGRPYQAFDVSQRQPQFTMEMEYSKAFEDGMSNSQPSEWLVYGSTMSEE
ncbi:transglutaminase-like domain-containing protein [Streptococcus ictaluri]|uniref:Transglutaminase-like protein n=1 Tax=Streptococcus ictaluri 707-05 TaxID=764299 RepID=G5K2K4_9STRE|nr:transglutaminase domain-containing protein [Streptococcus ictaluri]EHI69902.1 transglutaminase-like protein [Streptococcus ictaluri 707-05]